MQTDSINPAMHASQSLSVQGSINACLTSCCRRVNDSQVLRSQPLLLWRQLAACRSSACANSSLLGRPVHAPLLLLLLGWGRMLLRS